MSITIRRLLLALLGLTGGLACWPAMEFLLSVQEYFPGFLVFSLTAGALFGMIFGAFFASGDGIVSSRWHRIFSGLGYGALIGGLGGALGFFLAQGAFFLLGEQWSTAGEGVKWFGYPLTRAIGWAVLGSFVGAAEGFRSLSVRRIVIGILGGFLGGALGGALLEYLRLFFPEFGLSSLAGLILYGLLLGIFYGLVEKKMSFGVLRLLNGRFKGKEFILNQQRLTIGTGRKSDILLSGYRDVEGDRAVFKIIGKELYLSPVSKDIQVLVNDEPIEEKILKYEDVIKIGSAKLFYKHE